MDLLNKIDSTLMQGVNVGVKAWNYTTGKTKADLANTMLAISPILESPGAMNLSSVSPYLIIPAVILNSHMYQKKNAEIENREVKALEERLKDSEVEFYKKREASSLGLIWAGFAVLWALKRNETGEYLKDSFQVNSIAALGYALTSASFLVMRADYLPPRRSVLSRASDKLKEFVKEFKERPISTPIPASKIFINYCVYGIN